MKKSLRIVAGSLVLALGLTACQVKKTEPSGKAANEKTVQETANASSEKEVLEFYHGYHHAEKEWPVAKVMRDLYEKFAEQHKGENVEFKPIPVSGDLKDIMKNKVASGEFPDVIDLAGNAVSLAAINQGLVVDLKPFIDENKLEKNAGINYEQNLKDGKIYTVHEQLFTMGLWYNKDIFAKANAKTPDQWATWEDFTAAMATVRKVNGIYAFGAGEPSIRLFNTLLGVTEEGRKLLAEPLTKEGIESKAFADTLKAVMTEMQANGSKNAGGDANAYSKDFEEGKSAVFFNGVWAAGGMSKNPSLQPGIYPCGVAISSSGGGITISNKMSDAKKKLALEFLRYMISDEVQKVIFEKVGANPSNQNINVKELAEKSSDATTKILGQAIAQVKEAKIVVPTVSDVWGGDVHSAIINALTESAAENVNIEQKVADTQNVLKSIIA
ncbi:ABC transporter substrate-binding protein [Amygdalobacter nucleatus]|uniref:ABC transporter, solute-binding protein n=1 Tax=Amygdalobacter nucleatus TaxID=3029274 RepID=A0A133YDW3_9FIRM|nr:ABC transporter substrate-binding protein [Amygdalobacter nucleatus]KXB41385.1 ABC transporter, solute-binding protein [Amygdalobacter nucleatus]MDF0485172.1 ABC transporter substrate-binding protein [Amygdalobacter nucleatus]WEG36948.1 ABC transporter substrate-binding protein [Amygdalobacter nucleatus]